MPSFVAATVPRRFVSKAAFFVPTFAMDGREALLRSMCDEGEQRAEPVHRDLEPHVDRDSSRRTIMDHSYTDLTSGREPSRSRARDNYKDLGRPV